MEINQFRALRIQVNKLIQREKANYFETRFQSALSSKKINGIQLDKLE